MQKKSNDRVEKLIFSVNEELARLTASEEEIKELLNFKNRFHQYSLRNMTLVQKQFKGAVAVGSFQFWKEQGFHVKKGEKGIEILIPVTVQTFQAEDGKSKSVKYATKEEQEKINRGEIKVTPMTRFKVGHVFDITQTNAQVSDLPKLFPKRWLDGEVTNYPLFYQGLEKIGHSIGSRIETSQEELGSSRGQTHIWTKDIELNKRNSELQNIKTILHELGHAKLHTRENYQRYSRQEQEFQAELIAYAVCSYFDLDVSDYSLPYLKGWTQHTDIPTRTKLLTEVYETSQSFIQSLESHLIEESQRLEQQQSLSQKNEISHSPLETCGKILKECYQEVLAQSSGMYFIEREELIDNLNSGKWTKEDWQIFVKDVERLKLGLGERNVIEMVSDLDEILNDESLDCVVTCYQDLAEEIDHSYKTDLKIEPHIRSVSNHMNDLSEDKKELFEQLVNEMSQVADEELERSGVDVEKSAHADLEKLSNERKISVETLLKAGAEVNNQWITFPVHDANGEKVGIASRRIDDESQQLPKWKLSPNFPKNDVLYLYNDSKQAMTQSKQAIIVEGILDALSFKEAGFNHVVGLMGASMSDEQLARLKQAGAKQYIIATDHDLAGFKAGLKIEQQLKEADPNAQVFFFDLRNYKDPNELLQTVGVEGFKEWVAAPNPFTQTKLSHILTQPELSAIHDGKNPLSVYGQALSHFLSIPQRQYQKEPCQQQSAKNRSSVITLKRDLDIIDVCQEVLGMTLQKAGRGEYSATCPTLDHHEKTPSFFVSEVKQCFKCFGCGAGGDVIQLAKQSLTNDKGEALSFKETLAVLHRYRQSLPPEIIQRNQQRYDERHQLFQQRYQQKQSQGQRM